MNLQQGDKAPAFNLPTDGAGTCALADFAGNALVLYFYPKNGSPGCTTEAQDFRDAMSSFEKCGATVVGVSRDIVKKHDQFKATHDLNFTLISDEDGALCKMYGVWAEKNLFGRKYMGIERSTFLIDSEGKISKTWRKIRVKGHVDAVLAAAQIL